MHLREGLEVQHEYLVSERFSTIGVEKLLAPATPALQENIITVHWFLDIISC